MSDACQGGALEEGIREMEEGANQDPDYAVDPGNMQKAITWYLVPVRDELRRISSGFAAAHSEIKTAHDTEAAGWFGGTGNGDVRMASSSFLNAMEWQLRQLSQDQAELVTSLDEYQAVLEDVVARARQTDQLVADRFRAIDRDLEGMGY